MLERVLRLIPSGPELILWSPVGLCWAALVLSGCGLLKRRRRWPTPFTRKLNHFVIFISAAVVSVIGGGTSAVCAFALGVSSVVIWSVTRGTGNLLYEAMARERDEPHRSYYILVPLLSTAVGGILSNIVWGGEAAVLGYLVAGIADAAAEPIGVRFGRHRYRIPSRTSVSSTRSFEGSLAVLLISSGILLAYAAAYAGTNPATLTGLATLFALALVFTIVEALSPHGCDNALLQLVPSWAAASFIV